MTVFEILEEHCDKYDDAKRNYNYYKEKNVKPYENMYKSIMNYEKIIIDALILYTQRNKSEVEAE